MKFLVICFVAIVAVSAYESDYQATGNVRSDVRPDGSYEYAYETSNGIAGQESGVGGEKAQGAAKWTAPDGTPISFSYVADENGYRAEGPFIPQVPAHVVRLLEYIKTHPNEDTDYDNRNVQPKIPVRPFKGFQGGK